MTSSIWRVVDGVVQRVAAVDGRVCVTCGEPFSHPKATQRFCSAACYGMSRRRRVA